jgi:sphinganine-1-phosphate aldolase
MTQMVFAIILSLPSSRRKIASELGKTRAELKAKLAPTVYPDGISLTPARVMPQKGRDRGWLEEEWKGMKRLERGDVDSGRVSGTVYHVSSAFGLQLRLSSM